jgi:hypothetical protein
MTIPRCLRATRAISPRDATNVVTQPGPNECPSLPLGPRRAKQDVFVVADAELKRVVARPSRELALAECFECLALLVRSPCQHHALQCGAQVRLGWAFSASSRGIEVLVQAGYGEDLHPCGQPATVNILLARRGAVRIAARSPR